MACDLQTAHNYKNISYNRKQKLNCILLKLDTEVISTLLGHPCIAKLQSWKVTGYGYKP